MSRFVGSRSGCPIYIIFLSRALVLMSLRYYLVCRYSLSKLKFYQLAIAASTREIFVLCVVWRVFAGWIPSRLERTPCLSSCWGWGEVGGRGGISPQIYCSEQYWAGLLGRTLCFKWLLGGGGGGISVSSNRIKQY